MPADPDKTIISLQVTVYLREKDLDTFFAALGSVFNQIASEPYCTLFEVYQSQEDKGQILMLKNWSASREWLVDVGMRRPYLDEYHAIVEPLFIRPKDIKILDRLGGKWSIVKTNNGQIWKGDGDGDDNGDGDNDKVKGTKIVL
ncbi:putative quinol monooxygenase [Aspergillus stella-maris]|uniref:putative quinol monooxygenase n=1 Tax=Aspergillus stella-maris TaxID=1810926 RepID=UPI003CCD8305